MSVLTRIKNNQITDSTIFANNKVAAGSIVGSLFASNLTMTSDVLITGNLQVQGSTSYSTLASTNTYVNDPLIVLNNGATGANSKDIGLVFELGDDTNQMMIWDESASQFALASTSETGATAGDTTISDYADLRLGGLTADDNITATGTVTGGTLTDGTASLASGSLTSAVNGTFSGTVTGGTLTDGTASLNSGALTGATNGTFSGTVTGGTLTDGTASLNSGALTGATSGTFSGTVTGGTLTDGAFSVTSGAVTGVTTLATSGEATLASATISDLTAGRVPYAGTSGAIVDEAGFEYNAGTDTLSAVNVTSSGTVTGGTLTDGTASLTSGALTGATNGTFSGTVTGGTLTDGTASLTSGALSGVTTLGTTGEATLASATISDLTAGRVPYAGTAGAIVDEAAFAYDAVNNTLKVGDVSVDGANATIKTTGTNQDLVLAPSGSGAIDANGTVVTNLADPTSATDAVTLSYLESAISSDVTTIQQDDSYVSVNDDGVDPGWIDLTVDGTEVANLQVGTASIFADSLKVSDGSNVAVMNSATFYVGSTSEFDGAVSVDATTGSTNSTTGALKVAGGVGVAQNLNVGGTLGVTGEATLASATVSDLTSGRVVLAGTSGALEDSTNLTFNGSTLAVTGAATVSTTLDVNGAVNFNDTTQSTNATTGALIVDGGVGIAKNLNVGGDAVVTGNLTVNGTLTNVNSTDLTVTDKNIVIANGAADSATADGAGITVDGADATLTYVHATTSWDLNKVTKVTDATDSTSPTTGSLQTAGGLGVAKDVFIGGGDLGTDQTTFNLINTTATTLNIGGAATTLELGAASGTTSVNNNLDVDGDVNVDGGDLTTNQTTFNLVNANATTVNFAGAGTAITIGAATGTTTIQNAEVQVDGNLTVDGSLTITALDNTPIGQTTAAAGSFTTLTSSSEATLASATVSDLTSGRVTYAGASGALQDSANMTFDGTDLTVASAVVSDLTAGRVTYAGTSGALTDEAGFEYNAGTDTLSAVNVTSSGTVTGGTLTDGTASLASGSLTSAVNVTASGTVTGGTLTDGAFSVTSGAVTGVTTLATSGEATLASATVSDLTAGRVTYAGTSGALTDEAGFEYNAGTDTLSAVNVTSSGTVTGGTLTDGAFSVTSGAVTGVTSLTASGTITGGTLTDGAFSVTSGAVTGVTTLSTSGEATLASATVSDLTSGRVVLAGTSGSLTDDAELTYNTGTDTLSVVNVDATQVDAGNLTISGDNITGSNGEVVVNDAQADVDFRVESDTNTHMLFVDAGAETVLVGGSTATTDAAFKVDSVKSMMMPVGTTAQRPLTGVAGMLRFNSTVTALEFYDGSDWQNAQGSFTVIDSETFSGDDSTVAFTLSDTQTTASCIVSINGVVQLPTTAYSVSGTTLTFTEAPATGDAIEVRKLTTTTTVAQLADSTSSISVSGGDGVDIIVDQTGVTVGTSATTVDSFATTLYRMAKYVLMAENAAGDEWEAAEAIVVHDGTTATLTVYGVTATGADSWTYSATISGGNVLLQATAGEASTTVKFQPTYIRV